MDIKELEFIRDYNDKIDELSTDLTELDVYFEECNRDENIIEVPVHLGFAVQAMAKEIRALEALLGLFKDNIDEKYHSVWLENYPQMKR